MEMTQYQLKKIINEVKKKYFIDDYLIIHRFGKIYAGNNIVLILVASKHRADGLGATKDIINWLKIRATFWKREITNKGEFWLEQSPEDLILDKQNF